MFEFSPPFWLQNAHFQTMVSPLTRKFGKLPIDEEVRIEAPDGTEIFGKLWRGSRNLVLVYHGLGGHEDAPYVVGAAKRLFAGGYSVLRVRLRGAEQKPPITPAIYHAGLTSDLGPAVAWGKTHGFDRVHIVGFSLSANTILKWLGEGKQYVDGVFLVSPPLDLQKCADKISNGNPIYQNYFLKKLKQTIKLKARHFPDLFSPYLKREFYKTLRAFDDNITARFHGFDGAVDYYDRSSCHRHIDQIQNRVAIVHSTDDPLLDSDEVVRLAGSSRDNISVFLFRKGGHVGFYEGPRRGYRTDDWALSYFNSLQ